MSKSQGNSSRQLRVEEFETRNLMAVDWAAVGANFNAAEVAITSQASALSQSALGADLAGVDQSLGSAVRADQLLKDAVAKRVTPATTAAQLSSQLHAAGWDVAVAGDTPDAAGNVLRATRTTSRAVTANFTPGEVDTYKYWDEAVNGRLSGALAASGRATVVVEVGVDLSGGQPNWWVSPASGLTLSGLKGGGRAAGTVDIGAGLKGVKVEATYAIALDATLKFQDPDRDGKVRAGELKQAGAGVGDVNGSVGLTALFKAAVAGRVPLTFQGSFDATLGHNRQILATTLTPPDGQAFGRQVAVAYFAGRPNLDLFAPLMGPLGTKVPLTDKTVGDFLVTGKVKSALALVNPGVTLSTPVDQVAAKLKLAGATYAFAPASAAATMDKLVRGEVVTLLEQSAKASKSLGGVGVEVPLYEYGFGSVAAATISAYVQTNLAISFEATAGIDTKDVYLGAGSFVGLDGSVEVGLKGKAKVAGYNLVELSGGLSLDAALHARFLDPTPGDDKLYPADLAAARPAADLTVDLVGKLTAKIDLPKPFPDIKKTYHWDLARLVAYSSDSRPLPKVATRGAAIEAEPEVAGTAAADAIVLRRQGGDPNRYEVLVNGRVAASGDWRQTRRLTIDAGGGNDTIRVEETDHGTRSDVVVFGGDGDDRLTAVGGKVTFLGEGGRDSYQTSGGGTVAFAQDFAAGGDNPGVATPPTAATNLASPNATANAISLTWRGGVGEQRYEVLVSTDGVNYGAPRAVAANATQYQVTGLKGYTRHWLKVRSVNDAGAAESNFIVVRTR